MTDKIPNPSPLSGQLRTELNALSGFLFENPELGFQEFKAAKAITEFLRNGGFKVESPFGGLDTAFKASFGEGGPTFCFMAEYDALQGFGHACGHPLIAASAIAAGLLVKEELARLGAKGTVVVMGTPGEEEKGGKVVMLRNGAFEGIDATLASHPMDITSTDSGCLSLSRYAIKFHGRASHAAFAPEKGVNALDAAIQLFNGISAWRQQLPEGSRVHGIITNGGVAANIIPDLTECVFNVRAETEEVRLAMESRFADIAKAAALSTGCELELERLSTCYKASLYNAPLNRAFFDCAGRLGMNPLLRESGGRISSDFGDVSQAMPAANLLFSVTGGRPCALHTNEFREFARGPEGFNATMTTAAAMARIALSFLLDEKFRAAVVADFKAPKGQG